MQFETIWGNIAQESKKYIIPTSQPGFQIRAFNESVAQQFHCVPAWKLCEVRGRGYRNYPGWFAFVWVPDILNSLDIHALCSIHEGFAQQQLTALCSNVLKGLNTKDGTEKNLGILHLDCPVLYSSGPDQVGLMGGVAEYLIRNQTKRTPLHAPAFILRQGIWFWGCTRFMFYVILISDLPKNFMVMKLQG